MNQLQNRVARRRANTLQNSCLKIEEVGKVHTLRKLDSSKEILAMTVISAGVLELEMETR